MPNLTDWSKVSVDELSRTVNSSEFLRLPQSERDTLLAELRVRVEQDRAGRSLGEIAGDALKRGTGQFVDNLARGTLMLPVYPKDVKDAALAGFAEKEAARSLESPKAVQSVLGDEGAFSSPERLGTFALESFLENAPNLAASLIPGAGAGVAMKALGAAPKVVKGASVLAGLGGNLAMNTGENAGTLFEATGESKPPGAVAAGAGYTLLDSIGGIEGRLLRRVGGDIAGDAAAKLVHKTIANAVKAFGKSVAGEAVTELAQSQLVGRLVEWAYTRRLMRPDETWADVVDATLTEAAGAAFGAAPFSALDAGTRIRRDPKADGPVKPGGLSADTSEASRRVDGDIAAEFEKARARFPKESLAALIQTGGDKNAALGLLDEMLSGRPAAVPDADKVADEIGRGREQAALGRELSEVDAVRKLFTGERRAANAERMAEAREKRRPVILEDRPSFTPERLPQAIETLSKWIPEPALARLGADKILAVANMDEREQDAWIRENVEPALASSFAGSRMEGAAGIGEAEQARARVYEALGAPAAEKGPKKPPRRDFAKENLAAQRKDRQNILEALDGIGLGADERRRVYEALGATPEPRATAGADMPGMEDMGKEEDARAGLYAALGVKPEAKPKPEAQTPALQAGKPVAEKPAKPDPPGLSVEELNTAKPVIDYLNKKLDEWEAMRPERMGAKYVSDFVARFRDSEVAARVKGKVGGKWAAFKIAAGKARTLPEMRAAIKKLEDDGAGPSPEQPAPAPVQESPAAFRPGDRVTHAKHGEGEVKSARVYVKTGERKYTVKFPSGVQIVPESGLSKAGAGMETDGVSVRQERQAAPVKNVNGTADEAMAALDKKLKERAAPVAEKKGAEPPAGPAGRKPEARDDADGQAERDLRERRLGVAYARKSLAAMRGRLAKERSAAGRAVIQGRIDKLLRDTEEAEAALAFIEKRGARVEAGESPASAVKVEEKANGDAEVSVPKADKPGVPLKEQKRWLLAELSKAVEAVPQYEGQQAEAVEAFEKKLRAFDAHPNSKSAVEIDAKDAKKLEDAGVGKVTIEVPGDGVFTIWNTRYTLKRFAAKVEKKFPSAPHRPSYPSMSAPRQTPIAALGEEPERVAGLTAALSKALEPFTAADDDSRVELRSPAWNAEAGEAVAANGKTLAVVLGEPGGEREDKNIFGQYPEIVPGYRAGKLPSSDRERDFSASVDTERLSRKLKQARVASDLTRGVHLMADDAGAVEVFLMDWENNAYSSLDGRRGFDLGLFDADQLLNVMDFLRGRGNAQITMTVGDQRKPSVFSGKGEYVIVSPWRTEGDEKALHEETGTAFKAWAADADAPGYVERIEKNMEERKRLDREEAEKNRIESEALAAKAEAEKAKAEKRMAELRRTAPERALKAMKASPLYAGLKKALEDAGASIPENGDVLNTSVAKLRGSPRLREMQDALGKEIGIGSDRQRAPFGRGKVDTRNFDLTRFWLREDYFEADEKPETETLADDVFTDGVVVPQKTAKRDAANGMTPSASASAGPVTESAPRAAKKADAVEDAGEELRYNRRGRGGSRTWDDVKDMNPALKAREVVKGNVWPKPDYEELIAGGMEPVVAYMIKNVYDGIANKPVPWSAYHRVEPGGRAGLSDDDFKRYIEAVNRVRDGVKAWADDPAAVRGWASENARRASALMSAMGGKAVAVSELSGKPHDSLLTKVYPEGWKAYRDEIMAIGGNKALLALQPGTDEAVKAVKAIEKGWPKSREAWQVRGYEVVKEPHTDIQRSGGDGGEAFVTINRKGYKRFGSVGEARDFVAVMRPYVLLKKGWYVASFDTEEEAVGAARAEIGAKTGEGAGDAGGDRAGNVAQAEREGPARRLEGEDVTAQRIIDDFGMRGVNFGNWMKTPAAKAEAQEHLNRAYDALHDLVELLGVPPKAVSLNGMLGLAIGAQGNGGKNAAHFVAGLNEINLTRTAGAGTLAHEWGHALDHYFANQAGLATREHPFVSEYADDGRALGSGLRKEVADAFRSVVKAMKSRAVTEAEAKAIAERRAEQIRKSLDNWLAGVGRDFTDKEAYEALAGRIRRGELGDGKVAASSRVYLSPALVELRELYKRQTGRLYDLDNTHNVQIWADTVARNTARKEAGEEHVPQSVTTDYVRNALALDKDKGGKKYWSTPRELFARAFDAYVADALKAKEARNTYLSREGNEKGGEPEGGERSDIGKAFGTLVDAIETRETERGVEMYSVSRETPRGMELTDAEREEYRDRVAGWWESAREQADSNLTKDMVSNEYSHTFEPVGKIDPDYAHVFGSPDTTVYSAEWFFIDHILNHHPQLTKNDAVDMVETMYAPDEVRIDTKEGQRSLVFIRDNGRGGWGAVVVARRNTKRGELYVYKSTAAETKKPYQWLKLAEPESPAGTVNPRINTAGKSQRPAADTVSALRDGESVADAWAGVNGGSRADIEAAAKSMGVSVEWGDPAAMRGIDGMVRDGKAVLNPDADRGALLRFTFGHEAAHLMEGGANYAAFLLRLERLVGRAAVDTYLADLNKRRSKIGLAPLTKRAALREIAADLIGSRMADARFWNKVKSADAPWWKKVVEWVKGWISKITNEKGSKIIDVSALFDSPAALAEAMKAAEEAVAAGVESRGPMAVGGVAESVSRGMSRNQIIAEVGKLASSVKAKAQDYNNTDSQSRRLWAVHRELVSFGNDLTNVPNKRNAENGIVTYSDKAAREMLDRLSAEVATEIGDSLSVSRDGAEDGEAFGAVGKLFEGFKAARASEPKSRDLSGFARYLSKIDWYSRKIPALRRVFERALRGKDERWELANRFFGGIGEDSDVRMLRRFFFGGSRTAEMTHAYTDEAKDLQEYIVETDRDRNGPMLKEVESEAKGQDSTWAVIVPEENEDTGEIKYKELAAGLSEAEALERAHGWEAGRLAEMGFSEAAAEALKAFRRIHDREYDELVKSWRDWMAEAKEHGVKLTEEQKDLFAQLRQMGDLRGTYFPRVRDGGRYVLTYTDGYGLKHLTRHATAAGRLLEETRLRAGGAVIGAKFMADTPSEEAHAMLDMVALNDYVSGALTAMRRVEGRVEWSEIGMGGRWIDYRRKDGTTEKHYIVKGENADGKVFTPIFKQFGGHYYDDKQSGHGPAWHFVEPDAKKVKALFSAVLGAYYGKVKPTELFGMALVQQLGTLVQGRGASARKIARSEAVGEEVVRGYDEDVLKVAVRNAFAVAGSRVKTDMAKDFFKMVTGTDVSFDEWKRGAEDTDKDGGELYADYLDAVEERRISSAQQPNAFKEAAEFIREILRNDTGAEKVMGFFSGIAAVWRLSGVMPAIVNMTTLWTNVPAAAHAYGKLPFADTLRGVIGVGGDYVAWRREVDGGGKRRDMDEDTRWAFDQIRERGWDENPMTKDAAGVMVSAYGRVAEIFGRGALMAFGLTERFNRATTIAGVYRALRRSEPDADRSALLEKAKDIADKAHAVYGKEARPAWARGDNIGALVLRSGYTFKTYDRNLLLLMHDVGFGQRDAKALLWMAFAPAVFGLRAAPGVVALSALSALAHALGAPLPDDPEEAAFAWLRKLWGDRAEGFARAGITYPLGLDVSGSLSVAGDSVDSLLKKQWWELAGAPAGVVADWVQAVALAANGRWWQAVETASPRVVQSKMKAYREATEGVSTRSGKPVYFGDERIKADATDALWRALGGNPASVSIKRQRQWAEKDTQVKLDERKRQVYDLVRDYVRAPAERRSDGDWSKILKEIADYNAKAAGYAGDNPMITPVTEQGLKAVIRSAVAVPVAERRRAGADSRDFGFDGGGKTLVQFMASRGSRRRASMGRWRRRRSRRSARRRAGAVRARPYPLVRRVALI